MNETIGSRINRLRKEKSFSQEALAEKLGVSAQAVSKWENDQSYPDITLLPQLAKLLDVTVDDLLTGSSNKVQVLPEGQRKSLEELTLRIRAYSSDGDKVSVNLPMPLVKIGLEMGVNTAPKFVDGVECLSKLDMARVLELVEWGAIGKLIEAESEGYFVEVVVE